jgi:hypothetical protein
MPISSESNRYLEMIGRANRTQFKTQDSVEEATRLRRLLFPLLAVGTDYVVRGGLALIHPGETVIPAARGSGPYTGAAMGTQVHAPVSLNVSALDSQSVARFFNDNSKHMLRAINDAVKRGAHLGMRAIHP